MLLVSKSDFQVFKKDEFYHISGRINEHANFSEIRPEGSTLKLNLKQVENIDSIGTRAWIQFCDKVNVDDIEYHEVSIIFMNAIAMLPALLKPKPALGKVKSFFLPFNCMNCGQESRILSNFSEIEVKGYDAFAPLKHCPECGNAATLIEEDSEFLHLFIEVANG